LPDVEALEGVRFAASALALISPAFRDTVEALIVTGGVPLEERLVTIGCGPLACEVTVSPGSGSQFDGGADVDNAGVSNADEYANVIAGGGDLLEFVAVATDDTRDGTEPVEGVGEGASEGTGEGVGEGSGEGSGEGVGEGSGEGAAEGAGA